MSRQAHPKPEVEAALKYVEERGWRVRVGVSHAWGRMVCPDNERNCRCGEFCISSIWRTPRNAGNHARQIRRVVDHCIWIRDRR
jgi:hypothetical protein